jgi:hypothetical protein
VKSSCGLHLRRPGPWWAQRCGPQADEPKYPWSHGPDSVYLPCTYILFLVVCMCRMLRLDLNFHLRELTIRALESEPLWIDLLLHRICLCFGIVKDAQGRAFEVISFLSMDIVDHNSCVACTMTHCTHARDLASTCHCHVAMPHDIYALCVASDLCITCSYHMFGCNIVITSHMPCPIDGYMLDLIASHMMNNCSFHCVECHTIFTTLHIMLELSYTLACLLHISCT